MLFGRKDKYQNPMIEALPEPAFAFSEDGNFLFCNAGARGILKIINYPHDRKPEHLKAFIQVLRFSAADQDENILSLGGMRYTLMESGYDEGRLLRLIPSQENYHLLRLSQSLDFMPWGLITLDVSKIKPVVVFCNQKAGEFMAIPHRNMIGLPAADIFNVFGIKNDLRDYFTTPETKFYDHEVTVDGRMVWYRFHFIPYVQRTPYCLIVMENTTDGKIMEGQYFQGQRLEALGQLAGGVAHDFNNILSIIDGYARMAKKTVKGNDEAQTYLERIAQSVQRGSALTGQLLTFGRHKVMRDSIVDLGALVRDQEPLLRPLMDASIALSMKVEEGLCVDVAPDHICQILLNLCINARDAMVDGGNLLIEVAQNKDAQAYLRIIDTGSGMPPEVRAKMFDPFFTTKDQGKGTGLGLSMVYGLVKDMKGEIDVATKVGQGTSITINLPLSRKQPLVHEVTEDADGKIHLNGFTALIAEDEPALLDIVSDMMEEMGATVLRASNGNEALTIQEDYEGKIDFLLTDVVMPELNGVKLAELFTSVRPESKVMFMSGYPENGQMARVPLPENAFFMPKPVDFDKLGTVLKSMNESDDSKIRERWKLMTGQWKSV